MLLVVADATIITPSYSSSGGNATNLGELWHFIWHPNPNNASHGIKLKDDNWVHLIM